MSFRLFGKKRKEKQAKSGAEAIGKSVAEILEEDEAQAEKLAGEKVKVEREKIDLNNMPARLDYIQRLYEGIQEAKRQCGDLKTEFGQVTSYLKDIQLIDQAPPEEKKELYGAAHQIVELLKERESLQKKRYKITDAQKRAMENYEAKTEDDIVHLKEYEDYQMKIKHDLHQLGEEKNLLFTDKKDIIRRQGMLKAIGKALTIILVAFGAMLLALKFCFKVDITMPFVATAAFAFVIAALILNEARKNRIDMVITEKKCNRAISLLNKVKIKYVNNVRTMDYMCHKYQVRNATELDFVYGQYCKAKKEWARQREGTMQLHENNEILLRELQRLGIRDKTVWLSQARALVEPKEMVEVRHDLNVRRQKLREQLEYNTGVMEEFMKEIERIRDKKPEYAEEIEQILGRKWKERNGREE